MPQQPNRSPPHRIPTTHTWRDLSASARYSRPPRAPPHVERIQRVRTRVLHLQVDSRWICRGTSERSSQSSSCRKIPCCSCVTCHLPSARPNPPLPATTCSGLCLRVPLLAPCESCGWAGVSGGIGSGRKVFGPEDLKTSEMPWIPLKQCTCSHITGNSSLGESPLSACARAGRCQVWTCDPVPFL